MTSQIRYITQKMINYAKLRVFLQVWLRSKSGFGLNEGFYGIYNNTIPRTRHVFQ